MRTRNQPIDFRLERDFSQKLNVTFGYIRQNFKPLFTCVLYIVGPFALVAGIFSGLFQSSQLEALHGDGRYGNFTGFQAMIGSVHYLVSLFFGLLAFVLLSLTVYAYMVLTMDYEGPIEVAHVWDYVKSNAITVFYSTIGAGILCLVATLLLVLPGMYVSVVLSIFIIVMVREEIGFIEAVKRCFYLMKGHWWSTFGFLLVVGIIQGLISFVASAPSLVVYMLRILRLPGGSNDLLFIIASIFGTLVNLLLYVISVVALAFQYFHLVEVKDGIGLLEKVNQIGERQPLYPVTEQDEV